MSSRPGARSRGALAISLALPILAIATTAHLGLAISSRTSFAPMGAAPGDHLGNSVAEAGDVNGAIGNDAGGLDAGQAYVHFGAPSLPDQTADIVFTGINPGDAFGQSVNSAADVDDGGYSDLIVGSPLNDSALRILMDAGGAYLFLGGPAADATADSADKTVDDTPGSRLGYAVASAGDMQGDGQDDWLSVDGGATYELVAGNVGAEIGKNGSGGGEGKGGGASSPTVGSGGDWRRARAHRSRRIRCPTARVR